MGRQLAKAGINNVDMSQIQPAQKLEYFKQVEALYERVAAKLRTIGECTNEGTDRVYFIHQYLKTVIEEVARQMDSDQNQLIISLVLEKIVSSDEFEFISCWN